MKSTEMCGKQSLDFNCKRRLLSAFHLRFSLNDQEQIFRGRVQQHCSHKLLNTGTSLIFIGTCPFGKIEHSKHTKQRNWAFFIKFLRCSWYWILILPGSGSSVWIRIRNEFFQILAWIRIHIKRIRIRNTTLQKLVYVMGCLFSEFKKSVTWSLQGLWTSWTWSSSSSGS